MSLFFILRKPKVSGEAQGKTFYMKVRGKKRANTKWPGKCRTQHENGTIHPRACRHQISIWQLENNTSSLFFHSKGQGVRAEDFFLEFSVQGKSGDVASVFLYVNMICVESENIVPSFGRTTFSFNLDSELEEQWIVSLPSTKFSIQCWTST